MLNKYAFAKVYLMGLVVLSGLVLLCSLVMAASPMLSSIGKWASIGRLKSIPLKGDVNKLALEMQELVQMIYFDDPPGLGEGGDVDLLIKMAMIAPDAQEVSRVRDYVSTCAELMPYLKAAYLEKFDEKLRILQRSALAQLSKKHKDPYPRGENIPRVTRVAQTKMYGENALDESGEDLQLAREFLMSGVQHYTKTPAALEISRKANAELDGAISVFEKDLKMIRSMRRSSQVKNWRAPERKPESQRPKDELLNEFVYKLEGVSRLVHSVLASNWKVEQTLAEVDRAVQDRIRQIAELKKGANEDVKRVFVVVLSGLSLALGLLIIRDFMAAAIDTALNTRKISEAFADSVLEVG